MKYLGKLSQCCLAESPRLSSVPAQPHTGKALASSLEQWGHADYPCTFETNQYKSSQDTPPPGISLALITTTTAYSP